MNASEPYSAAVGAGITIRNLTVTYHTDRGIFPALKDVSLDIRPQTITGFIGESGSGKTTLAMAIMNAIRTPGLIASGSIYTDGVGDVLKLQGESLRRVHGQHFGFVFQASSNSLNPLKRIGAQLLDLGRSHGIKDPRILLKEARALAERMGMDGDRVLTSYQHELSGGMRQRAGIIFALVLRAKVVILDEPTTALDMLSQQAVLEIIRQIHEERGLTSIIITHDMGVMAEIVQRVVVLYAGRVVEEGPTQDLLQRPRHPYTKGLIDAIPRITGDLAEAKPLAGSPPDLATVPTQGCVFRDRCSLRRPVCDLVEPLAQPAHGDGLVTCHGVNAHD
ncbi:putative D,D-dipeptide transport ATP-binding protein DdpD [Peptococcaceae bacterium CEB3]|nr:putative D,D-dipeptide transport ATP-binding protein DdpD [Peptococcaceae bacterium CEB3]